MSGAGDWPELPWPPRDPAAPAPAPTSGRLTHSEKCELADDLRALEAALVVLVRDPIVQDGLRARWRRVVSAFERLTGEAFS